jgi:N utilization substance protein B
VTDALSPATSSPAAPVPFSGKARSAGRAIALQLLYAFEQNKYVDDGHLLASDDETPTEVGAPEFAKVLFDGFVSTRVPVDAAIDKRLENWTIHRLAVVDRAIMRLGAYEILYCADTPPKVAINEAIELAKRFGSEEKTTKLVNGVLDKIARDHRAGDLTKKA